MILIILGVGLLAFFVWAAGKQNEAEVASARTQLSRVGGYNPQIIESLGWNKPSISIDPASARLAVTYPSQSTRTIRFADVVGVEIEKNGNSLTRTNRGSQAVGATAGALLLGPAGLLVGGLTGSKRSEELVKQITLKIFTNDLVTPVIRLDFLKMAAGAKADSLLVRQAAGKADEWHARVLTILRGQTMQQSPPPSSSATLARPAVPPATADEDAEEMARRQEYKRLRRVRSVFDEQGKTI